MVVFMLLSDLFQVGRSINDFLSMVQFNKKSVNSLFDELKKMESEITDFKTIVDRLDGIHGKIDSDIIETHNELMNDISLFVNNFPTTLSKQLALAITNHNKILEFITKLGKNRENLNNRLSRKIGLFLTESILGKETSSLVSNCASSQITINIKTNFPIYEENMLISEEKNIKLILSLFEIIKEPNSNSAHTSSSDYLKETLNKMSERLSKLNILVNEDCLNSLTMSELKEYDGNYIISEGVNFRRQESDSPINVRVKALNAEHPSDEDLLRFFREIIVLYLTKEICPGGGVVNLLGAYVNQDKTPNYRIFLEHCDSTFGKELPSMSLNDCLYVMKCLANTMSKLNENDIVHRNLSPSNIFLNRDHVDGSFVSVKLSGFGYVKKLNTHSMGHSQFGQQDQNIYADPNIERLQAAEPSPLFASNPYSFKYDVYSFGIMLSEVLNSKKSNNDIDIDTKFLESLNHLISNCTQMETDKRPSFDQILETFDELPIQGSKNSFIF